MVRPWPGVRRHRRRRVNPHASCAKFDFRAVRPPHCLHRVAMCNPSCKPQASAVRAFSLGTHAARSRELCARRLAPRADAPPRLARQLDSAVRAPVPWGARCTGGSLPIGNARRLDRRAATRASFVRPTSPPRASPRVAPGAAVGLRSGWLGRAALRDRYAKVTSRLHGPLAAGTSRTLGPEASKAESARNAPQRSLAARFDVPSADRAVIRIRDAPRRGCLDVLALPRRTARHPGAGVERSGR